jgi:orotidine-5'-phosphate decarboxylase
MKNPIAFALDFPTLGDSVNFINGVTSTGGLRHAPITDLLGAVKVGLELFIASGRRAVEVYQNDLGIPVILDLKLHDIPETVERAVKAGGELGVKYMTLHIQQRATLEKAVKAAEPFGITLLGVTVLTSMTVEDFKDLDWDYDQEGELRGISPVAYRVKNLARFGASCGLKGFVCSPQETGMLHSLLDAPFLLVPGVRPAGAEVQDQKRVGTPRQAIQDGASMLVIGRPIRDAKDPKAAIEAILSEIQ